VWLSLFPKVTATATRQAIASCIKLVSYKSSQTVPHKFRCLKPLKAQAIARTGSRDRNAKLAQTTASSRMTIGNVARKLHVRSNGPDIKYVAVSAGACPCPGTWYPIPTVTIRNPAGRPSQGHTACSNVTASHHLPPHITSTPPQQTPQHPPTTPEASP